MSKQFLQGEEYDAIKRDVTAIIDDLELDIQWGMPKVNDSSRLEVIKRLTEYCDQMVAKYY